MINIKKHNNIKIFVCTFIKMIKEKLKNQIVII